MTHRFAEKEGVKTATFTLEYWRDDDWYVGQLHEIPGIFSQGKTISELEENIREVYELMLKERPVVTHRRRARRRPIAIAV